MQLLIHVNNNQAINSEKISRNKNDNSFNR